MTDPDPTKTVSLALTPITSGATPPNIQTDAFASAIAAAQQGGDVTQAYFDGMNQTADYWGWVADQVGQGENVWPTGWIPTPTRSRCRNPTFFCYTPRRQTPPAP